MVSIALVLSMVIFDISICSRCFFIPRSIPSLFSTMLNFFRISQNGIKKERQVIHEKGEWAVPGIYLRELNQCYKETGWKKERNHIIRYWKRYM